MDSEEFRVTAATYHLTVIILIILVYTVWVLSRQETILSALQRNTRTLALWQSRSFLTRRMTCMAEAPSTSTQTASKSPETRPMDVSSPAAPINTQTEHTLSEIPATA